MAPRSPFHPVPRSDPQADPAHSAAAPHSLPAWLASAFWKIDQHATAPSLLGSPGHRFGSPRCAAPRGRSSTVLGAGKRYDVCLFPGRAEEQSPHVPRKTGNVLSPAWPIAMQCSWWHAARPPEPPRAYRRGYTGISGRVLARTPRRNRCPEPNRLLTPCRVRSRLANATCSVQTDPTAVCVTVIATSYARVLGDDQLNSLLASSDCSASTR